MNTQYKPEETIEQVKAREKQLASRLAMCTDILQKIAPTEKDIKEGDVIGRLFAMVIKSVVEGNRELITESMLHTPNPDLVSTLATINSMKAEMNRGN